MSDDLKQVGFGELDKETKEIVSQAIKEVLEDFAKTSLKQFTADVLHVLRMQITKLVHDRIGSEKVMSVDVGLDLEKVENYDLFFKINIPKEDAEKQILEG